MTIGKRAFDILFALALLIPLSVVMAVVAVIMMAAVTVAVSLRTPPVLKAKSQSARRDS